MSARDCLDSDNGGLISDADDTTLWAGALERMKRRKPEFLPLPLSLPLPLPYFIQLQFGGSCTPFLPCAWLIYLLFYLSSGFFIFLGYIAP